MARKYNIPAKGTLHKRIRFRSRLEARWAVFFDTLGVKYKYEAKTYTVLDGVWYLPDFTLVKRPFKIVEIKPSPPTEEEINKCMSLSQQVKGVAIFSGPPGTDVKVMLFKNGQKMDVDWSETDLFRPEVMFDSDRLNAFINMYRLAAVVKRMDFTKAFQEARYKHFDS